MMITKIKVPTRLINDNCVQDAQARLAEAQRKYGVDSASAEKAENDLESWITYCEEQDKR